MKKFKLGPKVKFKKAKLPVKKRYLKYLKKTNFDKNFKQIKKI